MAPPFHAATAAVTSIHDWAFWETAFDVPVAAAT